MNALVVREPSNNFSSQIAEMNKDPDKTGPKLPQREVRFMEGHKGIQGGDREAEVRLGGFWQHVSNKGIPERVDALGQNLQNEMLNDEFLVLRILGIKSVKFVDLGKKQLVNDLKLIISKKSGFSYEDLSLFFAGQELKDSVQLSDYGIEN